MPTTDRLRALFNQQIKKFSNDIRIILSDDADAIGYLEALDGIMNISPDLVSAFYKEHIGDPYHDMIMSRNEKFLTGEAMERFGSGPFAGLCNEIHQKWSSLTEKEQNIIWDYFKVLTKISQKLSG
jgi:small nuclear ribonucleoprotein (snRNP)-like protein